MKKPLIVVVTALIVATFGGARPRWQVTQGFSSQPPRPLFDQYGGSTRLRCTNKTGHFILTKLGNRWLFCDPSGNGFISMSVANVVTNGNRAVDCAGKNTYPIYLAKYRDASANWAWQTLKRMTSWGFNSVGQDSNGNAFPWRTCSNCIWPGKAAYSVTVCIRAQARGERVCQSIRLSYQPHQGRNQWNEQQL